MYAVVLDRIVGDPAAMSQRVAAILGVTAYDVRAAIHAPGGGPAVLAVCADEDRAETTVQALVSVGMHAEAVDVGATRQGLGNLVGRWFELSATALVLDSHDGRHVTIPYGQLDVLIHGAATLTRQREETLRESSFSPTRALLSGGLVLNRVRETTRVTSETESDEVLFLFTGGMSAVRLAERSLVYQGLGSALQPARIANFRHLLAELRRMAPGAVYDDRLRKRSVQAQVLGASLSPDEYLDLAVALVARSLQHAHPPDG